MVSNGASFGDSKNYGNSALGLGNDGTGGLWVRVFSVHGDLPVLNR